MKFAAVTLLFATLALANPAPAAQPEAAAVPAPAAQPEAQPVEINTRAQLEEALSPRVAAPEPEIDAPAAGIRLDARDPKKSKPKTGSGGNDTQDAAGIVSPSRALQLGALGLGIMEIVRLWG